MRVDSQFDGSNLHQRRQRVHHYISQATWNHQDLHERGGSTPSPPSHASKLCKIRIFLSCSVSQSSAEVRPVKQVVESDRSLDPKAGRLSSITPRIGSVYTRKEKSTSLTRTAAQGEKLSTSRCNSQGQKDQKEKKKSIVASQRKAIIRRGVGPDDYVSQQGKNTSNITPAGAIPKSSTPSRKTQLNPDQYHRPDRSRTNIAKLIKLIYTRGSSMSSMTRKVTRRPSKEREKMSKHQKRSRTTRERKEEKKPGA